MKTPTLYIVVGYLIVAALSALCISLGVDLMAKYRMLGVIAIVAGGYVLVEGSWVFYKTMQLDMEARHG